MSRESFLAPGQRAFWDIVAGKTACDPRVRDLLAREYGAQGPLFEIWAEHSHSVASAAVSVAKQCGADPVFVNEASWLHDIGIKYTRAPGIHCLGTEPYLKHGVIGRRLCEEFGLNKHALVCERHVGTGFTVQEILDQNLPLPQRDMLNESLEERLICYVDNFFSKSSQVPIPLETVIARARHHGESQLSRFLEFFAEFSEFSFPEA